MAVTTATPGKTRSPNYPAIGLSEAIERLRGIYGKQRRYPATREVLAKLMGYGSLNGASATVLSALAKYGLLEGHGDSLRVSELGQDLVLHRKGDPEYAAALRAAASMPTFFRELRDQYPYGLPSEHSLRATLIKRGFNPKAIDGAVRAYRDTMEFVDVEAGADVTESTAESPSKVAMQTQPFEPVAGRLTPPPPQSDPWQRSIVIPLSVTDWATLQAAFPLSEAAWNQMMAVLTAMKPALVAPPDPTPTATAADGAAVAVPAPVPIALSATVPREEDGEPGDE